MNLEDQLCLNGCAVATRFSAGVRYIVVLEGTVTGMYKEEEVGRCGKPEAIRKPSLNSSRSDFDISSTVSIEILMNLNDLMFLMYVVQCYKPKGIIAFSNSELLQPIRKRQPSL